MNTLLAILVVGIGATAVMDLWSMVRAAVFGMPAPNYGLVGRWLAYMPRGKFRHKAIVATSPVRGEYIIGWSAHYLIGVAFAAVLIGTRGFAWIEHPTIAPALIVGIATVVAPLLLMQPGMGAGIAGSRTPRPAATRLQSLITHVIFGLGLYAAGWLAHFILLS